jgi:hypothetical protein
MQKSQANAHLCKITAYFVRKFSVIHILPFFSPLLCQFFQYNFERMEMKSPKQIAAEYGISTVTLLKKLKQIPYFAMKATINNTPDQKKRNRLFNINELNIIYDNLGKPI